MIVAVIAADGAALAGMASVMLVETAVALTGTAAGSKTAAEPLTVAAVVALTAVVVGWLLAAAVMLTVVMAPQSSLPLIQYSAPFSSFFVIMTRIVRGY